MDDWLRRRQDPPYRTALLIVSSLLGFLYGSRFAALFDAPLPEAGQRPPPLVELFAVDLVPPPKLGFQNKAGMVPPPYWRKAAVYNRQKFFESWLFQYIHHNRLVQPTMPYPHCQVYINHDYKFIWIKGHKVGSTAFREPLGWLCDDHWKIPENASFDRCSKSLWSQPVDMNTISQQWKDYFVFGIIRNPHERFASAYEYIKTNAGGGCEAVLREPTFGDICSDPYLHTVMCASTGCWCTQHHFRHFMPQAPCLLTEALLPAVDYIGDVATLDEDLDIILTTINARRDERLPPLKVPEDYRKLNTHKEQNSTVEGANDRSSVPPYVEQLYSEFPECLDKVAYFFHLDFILFGYDKNRSVDA